MSDERPAAATDGGDGTEHEPGQGHGGRPRGWLAPLSAADRVIARVEAIILAYGVLLMAANSVGNVVGRFVFGRSLYFTEEINQFLIVLVTFVGLGYAARKGRHIRMSAVYDQFGDTGRKALMLLIAGGTAAVMFVLAWYSWSYVDGLARRGTVTPSLQIPLYLTYLWVPVGFVITGIQYVLTVVRNLQSPDVFISYEQIDAYDEVEETAL
ncbi:TRAP transporter small permease [Hyphomicrobiales bacterium FT118]|uniref:TRAP transporter small permease protein n=1 Tax=Futiania mangrovi TaxID=2959716 RepID=A0A9J6PJR0_9PROT|nr:TRAP transporter small permease [Futiania mangrovii]MCP1336775.1 TRAP transporter small permease [Futiania mangrovii]